MEIFGSFNADSMQMRWCKFNKTNKYSIRLTIYDVRLRRYPSCSFPCALTDVILTQKLSTIDIFYGIRCSTAKTWDSVVFALRHASFAAYFPLYLISQKTFKRICTRKIITYFSCTYLITSNTHELWLTT